MARVFRLLVVELEAVEYRALIREADPMAAAADMIALSQKVTDDYSLHSTALASNRTSRANCPFASWRGNSAWCRTT